MSMSPEDFLKQAGGTPGFTFKDKATEMNVWKGGTVEFFNVRQATKFGTGTLLFDDAGNPVYELVVQCLTDDGERRAFYARAQQAQALRNAMTEVFGEVKSPEVGGRLFCRWIDSKPSKTNGHEPQKIYEFKYEKAKPASEPVVDAMKLA